MADKKKGGRRRERRNILHGQAHITASFNNTIINITDQDGNTLVWTSGGTVGFQGLAEVDPVRGAGRGRAGRPSCRRVRDAQGRRDRARQRVRS